MRPRSVEKTRWNSSIAASYQAAGRRSGSANMSRSTRMASQRGTGTGTDSELGREEPHRRLEDAEATERQRRGEEHEPLDARRMAERHLDGDAAAHGVADEHRPLDAGGVEEVAQPLGVERGVVRAQRLARLAEARQVGREHAVVVRQVRQRRQHRGVGRAEPVQEHDGGPSPASR